MTPLDDLFASDLFATEEARYDGVRLLLTRAGASITTVDLVTACEAGDERALDRLSRLSLGLGLEPRLVRRTIGELTLRSTLFAFEDGDGQLWLFVPGSDGMLSCLDMEGAEPAVPPASDTVGRALVFAGAVGPARRETASGTARTILRWMSKPLLAIIAVTFASNLLGLSLPLFTLAVYDQILVAGDTAALAILVMGLGLGLLADAALRIVRSRLVSRSAAHLDVRLSSLIFGKVLRGIDVTRLSAGQVTARLRDIDRIRRFLFGSVGISLIEAPFVLAYVVILILLLGWAAVAPIGFLAVGFAVIVAMLDTASRRSRAALDRAEEYGNLGTEIAGRLGMIQAEGSGESYASRFRDASARLGEAELLQQKAAQTVQLASGVLVSLTVLMTLTFGTLLAMDARLSVGALIASIALVWRMAAPLPALLQARLRWPEVSAALSATGEILDRPAGTDLHEGSGGGRTMAGRLSFSSVNFTYSRGQTAAIRNLSFEVAPGELVAITGHSGAGKSTLLDLACGLLEPQFGSVTIDGVNPQQVAPTTLRQAIGYLPREAEAVPLAIRDFLRLGVDPADRAGVDRICARLGLDTAIAMLPDGDRTLMSELHAGSGLARGLGLARALATDASMLLLDEPDTASRTARATLCRELVGLRGQSTVLVVTQEPAVIEIADRVMVLHGGALARLCTPKDIARKKQA